ncbi:response regulator [Microseira wollei]|nr:response regulator [Microseira wollei]
MQTLYPLSLLTQLANRHLNGCLQISSRGVTWSIYLDKGKLVYATNSLEPFERLDRQLTRLSHQIPTLVGAVPSHLATFRASQSAQNSDYQAICWLVHNQYLNPPQAAILIERLAREVFESLSLVRQGDCEIIESGEFTQFPKFCWLDISLLTNHLQSQLQPPKFSVSTSTVSFQSRASRLQNESDESTNESTNSIQDPPRQFNDSINSHHESPVKNNYTIACIDDNPSVLKTINLFLDAENYSVVMIDNPLKALMQIIRYKPDLILLDITMPNIDGYELCSLLRRHSLFKKTPIIMVTGNSGLLDRARAKLVRATDYLTKPFTKSDLLKIVQKYLP